MSDQKMNDKKGRAKGMLSNLVSSASAAKNDDDEGSADPGTPMPGVAAPVIREQDNNKAAGPSVGINSLLPDLPDFVRLPSAFVDLNTTRGGHLLGITNPPRTQNMFPSLSSTGDLSTTVSDPELLGPLGQRWAEQHNGQMPRTDVILRRYDAQAQRVARRNIEDQRGRRRPRHALPSPAKGPGPVPKQDENEKDDKSDGKRKSGRGAKRRKTERPCGWCGKTGHEVLNCAGPPAEDGFIHACGLHNSKAHTYLNCRVAKGWDHEDKWRNLVLQRANLPPMIANDAWEDVAYDYITGAASHNHVRPWTPMPLSVDFAKTIDKKKFDDFDYSRKPAGQLGVEENTSSAEEFMAWCKDWQKQYDAAAEAAETPFPEGGEDDLIDYPQSEYSEDEDPDTEFTVPTKSTSMADVSRDVDM
ncbi:hypothetical protein PG985_001695 [Apiospora marii]|uniref:uncharacterized protein n=1 Tax=Apiospora marii TaxID=335849 RepID=UPI00312E899B